MGEAVGEYRRAQRRVEWELEAVERRRRRTNLTSRTSKAHAPPLEARPGC
ncbi:hypothetical protein [Methanopyrus kandleri]